MSDFGRYGGDLMSRTNTTDDRTAAPISAAASARAHRAYRNTMGLLTATRPEPRPAPTIADHLTTAQQTDPDIALACATLGVWVSASRDDVHRGYKRIVREWHPDHAVANGIDLDEATRRTQTITIAYRTLMQAFDANRASTN